MKPPRGRVNGKTLNRSLTYAALYWSAFRDNGWDVNSEAVDALCGLAADGAVALAELRCDRDGHLLASIHDSPQGPLLWTIPRRKRSSPAATRAISEDPAASAWLQGNTFTPASIRFLGFRDDLVKGDSKWKEGWLPIFCRCGTSVLNFSELFREADRAKDERRTIKVIALSSH